MEEPTKDKTMSDKTIRLVVDLTYDTDNMHGDDADSIEWFHNMLLRNDLQLIDCGDLGDMIGSVRVVSQAADRIEELDLNDRRYRWIRDGGWMLIGKDRGNGPEWPEAAEVDRLVDAAIAKAKGESD